MSENAGSGAAGSPFPRLFTPGRIGRLEVSNRIVMGAMLVGYAEGDGRFSARHLAYFEARARGGAGMLVTESVMADTALQPVPQGAPVTVASSDVVIPRLTELTRAVHRHGARIAFQVTPGEGRQSHIAIEGRIPSAPSAQPAVLDPKIRCRALTAAEIDRLVEACGNAALRAAMAGFDLIDLHAHTGYLIDQFMSPQWNHRDDAWGGDFDRRMAFPLAIIDAIRRRVGKRFPLSFRLTAEHRIAGGRRIEEAQRIARCLEAAGIDLLTVDAGCYEAHHWMSPPIYLGDACLADLAAAIRQVVSIPVAATGSITRPEQAEALLAAGKADFVVLGRSLLADPDWPRKARQGRPQTIRPCILCNEYCLGRIPAACMVNPSCGREVERALVPTAQRRRVLVVGGGPGGLEAARVAAARGHEVTLWERGAELGGQLVPAGDAGYKRCLHALRDQLVTVAAESGVRVEVGREADLEQIVTFAPDAVIVATGARAKAEDRGNGTGVLDVFALHGGARVGARVIIAGGGLNGCDAAIDLAQRGHEVVIVDRHEEVGRDLNHISRSALHARLAELGVVLRTAHRVCEIHGAGVVALDAAGQRHELAADTVIDARGVAAVDGLAAPLRGKVEELLVIGDCAAPRKIGEAIHEGFAAGCKV